MGWYLIGAVLTGCLGLGLLAFSAERREFDYDEDKFEFLALGTLMVGVISASWLLTLLPALAFFGGKYLANRKVK